MNKCTENIANIFLSKTVLGFFFTTVLMYYFKGLKNSSKIGNNIAWLFMLGTH